MIPFCYWGDNMTEEKVQMVIRLTEAEREQVKVLASKENKSMNQYVIDKVLAQNDSKEVDNDIAVNVLSEQIATKDKQISMKDEQIQKMQQLLSQQQELSLFDKKEKERSQLELKEEVPKNFFQKIFNL